LVKECKFEQLWSIRIDPTVAGGIEKDNILPLFTTQQQHHSSHNRMIVDRKVRRDIGVNAGAGETTLGNRVDDAA
jgi:hypothetical protein